MLRMEMLEKAADDFVSAALLGERWEDALGRLAIAAGAGGAVLMRNRGPRLLGVVRSESLGELVADYLAGRIPPNSRYRLRPPFKEFRFDHDDFTPEQLARDPYYQEFLRPNDYFWHANVSLDFDGSEEIELSLKRMLKAEPYGRSDAVKLNALLPSLRAATRIARSTLDGEAAGMARILHHRGDPVFELDSWGRVLRTHAFDDNPARAIRVLRRGLVAADAMAQAGLDRAVAVAVAPVGRPAIAVLPDASGIRHFLQVVPVGGRRRDIFLAAAAVAVFVHRDRPTMTLSDAAMRDAFQFTDREVEVVHLLRQGLTLTEIAQRLRIGVETVRGHLKSVFGKTDTNRQAELVALLARIAL